MGQRVERFGHRVFLAVALGTGGGDSFGLGEAFGEANGPVLDAAIGKTDQLRLVPADALAGMLVVLNSKRWRAAPGRSPHLPRRLDSISRDSALSNRREIVEKQRFLDHTRS